MEMADTISCMTVTVAESGLYSFQTGVAIGAAYWIGWWTSGLLKRRGES